MTRFSRLPLAEGLAVVGAIFGAWLIHNTFQHAADTPNWALLFIGAVDILLCFGFVGYLLRQKLRDNRPLPRAWIAGAVVLLACFLGWIAALFIDSERLLAEQQQLRDYDQQVAQFEDSVRHLGDALPAAAMGADRKSWEINHDRYARLHDQLQAALHSRPTWDKDLIRIDDQVKQMQKALNLFTAEAAIEERWKWRGDFRQARDKAMSQTEALRGDIVQSERDTAATYRARWHAVGASALTGVVLLLGCLLFWLIFDRELRRSWHARARLADSEARFRGMVENQEEPIAVLDGAGNILYANPAWTTAFNYELDDLRDGNLLELIHPDDRTRVQTAMQSNAAAPCRLSADYGVWHDVELQCQAHVDARTTLVRVRDVRETPDVPMPQPEVMKGDDTKLQAAEARVAELDNECSRLRDGERQARAEARHQRWLLDSHSQANSEGVLILSAQGAVLSWNPSFARIWKLSEDTMAAHTWPTIAAHMESLVEAGWDDFRRAASHQEPQDDSCWEMELEGERTLEVYAQAIRMAAAESGALAPRVQADSRSESATQFHFRDVTKHKDLETQVRDQLEQVRGWENRLNEYETRKQSHEASLREREKRLKHLEKQIDEYAGQREEWESTLRDHQDRLHQMHEVHESHATALKNSKDAMRRLAAGVANDVNNVLSVVLGNTDVLRDNLPKDNMAQNYVDEIRQAANRGAEMSQRLLAFSRNHLLQMAPVELNRQLAALEPKLTSILGHDVELHWDQSVQELWVKTDPHPLEQAILHLVTHARTHMPKGGTLKLDASRVTLSRRDLTHADMAPGAYIRLTLQDTGAGIDEDTLPHVFEPYHPVHEGQKGDLTLATAYGILRQSGGCIDVASEKGKGTAWTILLPETSERPALARASA